MLRVWQLYSRSSWSRSWSPQCVGSFRVRVIEERMQWTFPLESHQLCWCMQKGSEYICLPIDLIVGHLSKFHLQAQEARSFGKSNFWYLYAWTVLNIQNSHLSFKFGTCKKHWFNTLLFRVGSVSVRHDSTPLVPLWQEVACSKSIKRSHVLLETFYVKVAAIYLQVWYFRLDTYKLEELTYNVLNQSRLETRSVGSRMLEWNLWEALSLDSVEEKPRRWPLVVGLLGTGGFDAW